MLSQKNLMKKTTLISIKHLRYKTDINENFPRSSKKLYAMDPNKSPPKKNKRPEKLPPRAPTFQFKTGPRTNDLHIQMLPKQIYDQIFKKNSTQNIINQNLINECKDTLHKHNMVTHEESYIPDIDLKLPPLQGSDIEEHFNNIALEQLKPYQNLTLNLLTRKPDKPKTWFLKPGWTRYVPGREPESVPYPKEKAIVFDIEVCMLAGKAPTLATAMSNEAWYGWISQSVIDGTSKLVTTHQYSIQNLIPTESYQNDSGVEQTAEMIEPKVIVGHNVSFDRARIKEQYWLKRTGTRFIDTMSLHVSVSGVTSYQRAVLKSGLDNEAEDESWKNCTSLNSLQDVYKLYCGKTLKKDTRDLFVSGTLKDIQNNFQEVMDYCSSDVEATYDVLKILFPLFLERFPHPATLAGMLELSTAYLPINSNWNSYISNSDDAYADLDIEGRIMLAKRAEQACQLLHDEKYKEDLWLWDQDWQVKELKFKKSPTLNTAAKLETTGVEYKQHNNGDAEEEQEELLKKKFEYLEKTKDYLSSVNRHLPGYPNWYKKLCTKPGSSPDWVPGPHLISTSMQITPKLLSLTWEGYPLHYVRNKGWGFLVPFTDDFNLARQLPLRQLLEKCPVLIDKKDKTSSSDAFHNITQLVQDNLMRREYYSRLKRDKTNFYNGSGVWCDLEIEDCCFFIKLPHKNGAAYNVGNPLSRDFLNKFSENVLAGDTESAEHVLTIARMLSYWRNNRARIYDQMVVWLSGTENHEQYGAILPQVIVSGTLTRRAVESTWMTASNAHPERVGSELRAMVQAPAGYNIVGADVDSQELWIASVIGDSHKAKTHGATPLGWMTLSGTKSNGTDMHSVTAKAVGISRDHAKVLNYARIYGAGQNFAERLLKQFNPSLSDNEARTKAMKMFALTKGKRIYHLKNEFQSDWPNKTYNKWAAIDIAKKSGKVLDEMFENPQWIDGTESAMFNRLEAIANDAKPKTPFLSGALSRALEPTPGVRDDRYLPTRVNWVVQSGAVDFLHLMLVSMRWIMGDKARFCLSFHDEIRYVVDEKYKYQAALAMHVTNLWTRVFCSCKLGIYDLPYSVAFFSSVEIDTVLRKDAKHDCKTPSNPHGLEKGYNIPNGESLDIYQSVEKAKGTSSSWFQKLKT